MQIFLHPWMLLRRISVQAPRGDARVALAVFVAPRPVHAKLTQVLYVNQGQACHESDTMALILCADEVWRERRSEILRLSPCHRANIACVGTRSRTKWSSNEACIFKNGLYISFIFKNQLCRARGYFSVLCKYVSHFPELS